MTTAPSYPPQYPAEGYPAEGYPGEAYPAAPPQPPAPAPPPPGPGVQPPFPAPPVEGRGKRIGLSLGIGAGVLLLVVGGGIAAVIGLGTSMTSALDEQARVVVGDYLDALHDLKYDQAYGMLCKNARDDETATEYRRRVGAMEPIDSYRLGDLDYTNLTVPVDATYTTGDTARLEAYLGQNEDTGAFEVCDLGE
jgi:hypothetical protein